MDFEIYQVDYVVYNMEDAENCRKSITVESMRNAKYIVNTLERCEDVKQIDIISATTGEVLYSYPELKD